MSDYEKGEAKCVVYGDSSMLMDVLNKVANRIERFGAKLHDMKRLYPPMTFDEQCERHERLAIAHTEEYMRLTGKEPERTAPTLTAEDLRGLRRLTQRWWTGAITNREFEHFLLVFLDDAEGKLGRSGR